MSAFNKIGDVINNTNPGLFALGNSGGATPTHKLMYTNPAFHTGMTMLTKDQRGVWRQQYGATDKGAFELFVGE